MGDRTYSSKFLIRRPDVPAIDIYIYMYRSTKIGVVLVLLKHIQRLGHESLALSMAEEAFLS